MSWNTCKYPECESWASRPDGDYCESHRRANAKIQETSRKQSEKREQLLKKAKEKSQQPRTKVKKVSPKREELNKEYFKLVEQFKKDNPKCKANVNQFCTIQTTEPHHRLGRGKYLTELSTWLPVCRSCHSYIEAHPQEAKERGWSESRLAKPKETI